ncbi:MAG: hypothetical protein ACI8UR_000682 [Natronomonas sp.]|jgi:hypothetical protein|uniref:matrixin family metalloprotease n=1 Tax=Natronomonas sp. TaxID=2184060 RepID=UPI00398A069B
MGFRRRAVLAGAVGAAAALAGCSTPEDFADDVASLRGHPLEGTTTIQVVDRSDSDLDLEAIADEALDFWAKNAEQYAGFDVEFRMVGADPDVEIEFLNSREELDGCQEHSSENVLGCAPLLNEGNRLDRPATAEVVALGRPYGDVRTTTQHEIGHLLGLDHGAEPAYIMSNRIEDRLPEYEARTEVLDAFEAAWDTRNDGTKAFNEGIQLWNDGEYERAIEPFGRASERYGAIADSMTAAEEGARAFEEMKRPDTVDRERLHGCVETTRTATDLLVSAADDMRAAAEAIVNGDRRRARDRQQSANEALEELESLDVPTTNDVARALGLLREESAGGESTPSGT